MLIVAIALVARRADRARQRRRRRRGCAGSSPSVVPAVVCYVGRRHRRLVRQQLHRQAERAGARAPYITHNIEMTRQRLRARPRSSSMPFPADTGVEAVDAANNQDDAAEHPAVGLARAAGHAAPDPGDPHLLRLPRHRHRPLRRSTASVRQMMLAARELNVDKLPESSRNWINEKLIYTHGYGVTMNPVNGFTPEGLPTLVLSNMPVQSTIPALTVTRPGDLFRRADQHRRLREDAARRNSTTRRARPTTSRRTKATAASVLGGFFRRLLIALDRGDLAKLPFSDDVTPDSRLLMRRNIRERVEDARAVPHLRPRSRTSSSATTAGCSWMMDAFTTSDTYPYARHLPARTRPRQLHAQQRQGGRSTPTTARPRSTCSTTRIRSSPPTARSSRRSSRTRSAMPAGAAQARALSGAAAEAAGRRLRAVPHDRSRRCSTTARICGRVASEVGMNAQREQARADDGAELRADEAAGREDDRVRRDPAVHAGQPQQPDRLDRRPQRRRATTARRSSTTSRRRSWSTARCRSRRGSIRTRSSRGSCRCGTSRDRTCAAAA